MPKISAKERLRIFLLARIGEVLSGDQLRQAAGGITEWARRVRELRDEEGWPIKTHNDLGSLKPGQYVLEAAPPERAGVSFARTLSTKLRAQVLDRNGFTCQMCGLTPGEIDPNTGRPARLHIGHIQDKSLGGKDELSNLRTLCSTCNQGATNLTLEKPSQIWLLSQVRRAREDDQVAVYNWLRKKFAANKEALGSTSKELP
ncbi:MAG: HNH endonuclease [Fimbriimonadaceae bacterium]|nr:HNH endonuclease [Fimbriimonadaceae bacterium]QYK57829.1 MAG: HNH endonuclease [Fimbriimonadaceae bacterium]